MPTPSTDSPSAEPTGISVTRIFVGKPQDLPSPRGPWRSAIIKHPVPGPVEATTTGLVGDEQANKEVHGGPDKAMLCYAQEHYPYWDEVYPGVITEGGFGENLLLTGASEETVCLGDVYRIGASCRVQVADLRKPCWKLSRRWNLRDLQIKSQQNGRLGWYLRVLTPGPISEGDPWLREARPAPEWPISRVIATAFSQPRDREGMAALIELPFLAAASRDSFARKLQPEDPGDRQQQLDSDGS